MLSGNKSVLIPPPNLNEESCKQKPLVVSIYSSESFYQRNPLSSYRFKLLLFPLELSESPDTVCTKLPLYNLHLNPCG